MREGWHVEPLSKVCQLINRGISPVYLDDGGTAVLNQKCIRDHSINYDLGRRHCVTTKRVSADKLVRVGDVLVNSTGTGTLGRVAQVRDEPHEPTTVDSHVTIVRPKDRLFFPEFFGYALIAIENQIQEGGEGCGGQTELARSKLANDYHVSFPTSIPEQRRIVAILDEVFEGIATAKANAEKNLQNAREVFESHLNAVFSQRGEGWVEKQVKEIAKHALGKMLDKNKNKGSPQRYLRNQNVRWFNFDLSDLYEMPFLPEEHARYTAVNGDVLICEGGYPGRSAVWAGSEPIYFQKAIHRVRFHEPEHNQWFVFYLYHKDKIGELKSSFSGTGIQHFTGKALAKFLVPIPPLGDLQNFVTGFESLYEETQHLESLYQQKLTALNELKQSLLHQAFNGDL